MSRTPFKTLADLPDFKPGDVVYALADGGRDDNKLPRDIPLGANIYHITEVFYTDYGLGCKLSSYPEGKALDHSPYQGYVLALEQEDGVYPFFMPEESLRKEDVYDHYDVSSFDLSKMWKKWVSEKRDASNPQQTQPQHLDVLLMHRLVTSVLQHDMTVAEFERVTGLELELIDDADVLRKARHIQAEVHLELMQVRVSVDHHRQHQEEFERYEREERQRHEMYVDEMAFLRDILNPLTEYAREPIRKRQKKEKKYARPEKQFDNSHPRSPRARRA